MCYIWRYIALKYGIIARLSYYLAMLGVYRYRANRELRPGWNFGNISVKCDLYDRLRNENV